MSPETRRMMRTLAGVSDPLTDESTMISAMTELAERSNAVIAAKNAEIAALEGTLAEERACRAIEVDLNNDQLIEAERIIGVRDAEIAALTKQRDDLAISESRYAALLVRDDTVAALQSALTETLAVAERNETGEYQTRARAALEMSGGVK